MAKVIGIDLGTTNSCMAILEHGNKSVISSAEGGRTTPSVVSYSDDKPVMVGDAARRQAILNSEGTITSIKRFIGRTIDEVEEEEKIVSYHVGQDDSGAVRVIINDEIKTPEEISAQILGKIKSDAEEYFGEDIEAAVITVPAYFNDAQRQATKQAAEIAGLEVLRLVNEPTAAALAYGFNEGRDERLLVFDMGGGTLDVSVLDIGDEVFEVIATSGDNHLGGDNFDKRIADWLIEDFKKQHGIDLTEDAESLQRLYEAAEKAKIELSNLPSSDISLPFIAAKDSKPLHLDATLSRTKLEELTSDLIERAMIPLEKAIDSLDGKVEQVILVGGMTRMPAVGERVTRMVGVTPRRGVNPDEAVAIGAAIQAGVLAGEVEDVLLLDVIPLSLGIAIKGDIMKTLIESNTTIPTRTTETFTTSKTNQTSVEVKILQGERPMADDNRVLGRLELRGIPPSESGIPQIEVVFDVNADGILNVSALDLGTGAHQSVEISSATGLESSEVERLRLEAASNREADLQVRRNADILVKAEIIRDQADKCIRESGQKMSDIELASMSDAYNKLSQILSTVDPDPAEVGKLANITASQVQSFISRVYGEDEEVDGFEDSNIESEMFSLDTAVEFEDPEDTDPINEIEQSSSENLDDYEDQSIETTVNDSDSVDDEDQE